jgi:hypothetical protein
MNKTRFWNHGSDRLNIQRFIVYRQVESNASRPTSGGAGASHTCKPRRRRRQIGDGLMGMVTEPYLKVLRMTPLAIRIRSRLKMGFLQLLPASKLFAIA